LLHEKGYTIAGARLALKSEAKAPQADLPFARGRAERAKLDKLRQETRELLALLSGDGKAPIASTSRKKSSATSNNLHRLPGPELFS